MTLETWDGRGAERAGGQHAIRWPVWIAGGAAFANGLFEVFRILSKNVPGASKAGDFLPYGLHYWNRSLGLIFAVALIYLSFNLLRRKRAAWWIATAGSAFVLIVALIQEGPFTDAAPAPAVALALLLVFRRRFTVYSEPRSLARGGAVVALSLLVALAYGTFGFWMMDPSAFDQNFSVKEALYQTLREYTLTASPDSASTAKGGWFLDSLNMVGGFSFAFAAYSLFRPLRYRFRTLPRERKEARAVLERYGTSSLDFFKLYPTKSYFFSEDRRSFVAYKVANNTALALGDASGPADSIERTTAAFVRYCEENGWKVAYYQVLPDLAPMYRRLGMRVVKVGEEAVVDLERFASKTAKSKKFRYTRRRYGEREGYSTIRHRPPHSQELLDEVEAVSRAWLTMPGRRERGFSLGRFERDYISTTTLFVVRNARGETEAFVNEVPSFRSDEATIDLMRHRPDMPNGLMDLLFVELMLQLAENGYKRFDLGLAPLAGIGLAPESPLEERALEQLSERLTRFFSYKGLSDYKSKFDPLWEDRYLAYRGGPAGLLATGVALARLTEK